MIEIENDSCDYHLHSNPTDSSTRNAPNLADSRCEREIPFNRRSFARDFLVAHLILITYGMASCGSLMAAYYPFVFAPKYPLSA